MQIILEIPDDVAHSLEAQVKDPPRALLESFALKGYRSGTLIDEQVGKLLGYGTRMQVDDFLEARGVYWDYTLEDLDRDAENSREFSSRRIAVTKRPFFFVSRSVTAPNSHWCGVLLRHFEAGVRLSAIPPRT